MPSRFRLEAIPQGNIVKMTLQGLAYPLRVKDVDFASHRLVVRDGTGAQDRVTVRPRNVKAPLPRPLQGGKKLPALDWAEGFGRVSLPSAWERKAPHAHREWP